MMIDTIKLFIDARASLQPDLIESIKLVSANSLSEVLHAHKTGENMLLITIKTTADKLEHLGYKLAESGILLAENASDILRNAANQYSLYRNIHLNMNIESMA
jgi:adenylate cyclase